MSRIKEISLTTAQIANLAILALIAVEIALWAYFTSATGVLTVVVAALSTYLGTISYLLWGKRDAGLYKALRFAWSCAFHDVPRTLAVFFVLVAVAVFLGFRVAESSRVVLKGEILAEGKRIDETFCIKVLPEDLEFENVRGLFELELSRGLLGKDVEIVAESEQFATSVPVRIKVSRSTKIVLKVVPIEKVQITKFEIRHLRGGDTVKPVGIIGETSDGVIFNDSARIEVELDRPRYCFLIAYNPDGTDQLCFPLNRNEAPQLRKSIEYHPDDPNTVFRFSDGVGAQVFALFVSRNQLPPYNRWIEAHEPVSWTATKWKGVLVYDGMGWQRRDHDRAEGKLEAGEFQPLLDLCESLSNRKERELLFAIGFPVEPRNEIDDANE